MLHRFASARDEGAFTELLRRFGPTVYGVCRRVLGNGPNADDAFQAVFLVLARKTTELRTPAGIGNWLYGVAVRTATKARIMNAKRRARQQSDRISQPVSYSPPAAPDLDMRAVIDAELAALPDRYRAALVVCDLNGRTRREAARELGWPEGTVAARLAHARRLLAARLTRRGVTLTVGALAAVPVPASVAAETVAAVRALHATGTAALVSPAAQRLSDEVTRSMTMVPERWLVWCGLVLVLVAGGAGLCATPDHDPPLPTTQFVAAPVPRAAEVEWREAQPIELSDGGRVTSVAFAPGGKIFAVCRDSGDIDFFDPTTRKHQQRMAVRHDPTVNANTEVGTSTVLAFRPTPHPALGDVFAVTHKNGVIFGTTTIGLLADNAAAVTGVPGNWALKGLDPHALVWVPGADGSAGVAVTNGAVTTAALKAPAGTEPQFLGGDRYRHKPAPLAPLPGSRLLTTFKAVGDTDTSPQLCVVPLADPDKRVKLTGHRARPMCATAAPDGKTLVTGDERGEVIVWDGETGGATSRVVLGAGVVQLALAPDERTLTAVCARPLKGAGGERTELELYLLDARSLRAKPKPCWTTGDKPLPGRLEGTASLAFSPNGKTLLVAFADPFTRVAPAEVPKSMGVRVWELVPKK